MFLKMIYPQAAALLLGFLLALPLQVQAHRLNVFAYAEHGSIIVESNFGTKRPAMNADVKVTGLMDGHEILRGKTDRHGRFVFPLPDREQSRNGLLITVNGGQGHQNTWKMEADELMNAGPEKTASAPLAVNNTAQAPKAVEPAANADNAAWPTTEQLRQIIREELEKVQPHAGSVARPDDDPGVTEIIGGIGWIIGLTGIFLWHRSKNRK